MSTKSNMFDQLNHIRGLNGKQPLKSWKQSLQKLEEAIKKERAAVQADSEEASQSNSTPASKTEESGSQPKAVKSKVSVASICRAGFDAGLDNQQIHDQLMDLAESGHIRYDKSRRWYVSWYRSQTKRVATQN